MPLISGRPTPFTAISLLTMFERKKIVLDWATYECCVDEVVSLLERVNDEKYRLTDKSVTPEG